MRRRINRDRRDERGASAVEFALVVPFLLLILFGIIAYAFVFAQTLSLGNSARQSARSGVIDGTTCGQISTLAKDAASTLGMTAASTTVSIKRGSSEASASLACGGGNATKPCSGQATATNLYVVLEFNTTPIVPLVPIPAKVSGKGVFRCEFS